MPPSQVFSVFRRSCSIGAPTTEVPVDPDPIEIRTHGARGPTVLLLHGGPGAPGSVSDLAADLSPEFGILEPL
jgi:pimeloyl-ACP methyl ester carboxylesterase